MSTFSGHEVISLVVSKFHCFHHVGELLQRSESLDVLEIYIFERFSDLD